MVLACELLHRGPADPEDRPAATVRAADLYALKLASAREPESTEEQIVRLQHGTLPVDLGRRAGIASVTRSQVSPSLL